MQHVLGKQRGAVTVFDTKKRALANTSLLGASTAGLIALVVSGDYGAEFDKRQAP